MQTDRRRETQAGGGEREGRANNKYQHYFKVSEWTSPTAAWFWSSDVMMSPV